MTALWVVQWAPNFVVGSAHPGTRQVLNSCSVYCARPHTDRHEKKCGGETRKDWRKGGDRPVGATSAVTAPNPGKVHSTLVNQGECREGHLGSRPIRERFQIAWADGRGAAQRCWGAIAPLDQWKCLGR